MRKIRGSNIRRLTISAGQTHSISQRVRMSEALIAILRACPESARFCSGSFCSPPIFSHQPKKMRFLSVCLFSGLKNYIFGRGLTLIDFFYDF